MNIELNNALMRLRQIEETLDHFFRGSFGTGIKSGKGGPVDHVVASMRAERDALLRIINAKGVT